MAVGARFGGDGRSAPLAELWSNARPHLLAVPRPAARGGIGSRFSGVSCISPRDCVAVGDNQRRSIVVPLAQIWNGASWRAIPPPAVPRARVSLLTVKESVQFVDATFLIHVEGQSNGKPCCVAEWLVRYYPR